MAFWHANRVKQNASTSGTGTFTLGTAITDYQTFTTAGYANGDTFFYAAVNPGSGQWETGRGRYLTGPARVERVDVWESSTQAGAVNFSAPPQISVVMPGQASLTLGPKAAGYAAGGQAIAGATTTKLQFSTTETNNKGNSFASNPWDGLDDFTVYEEGGTFQVHCKVDAQTTWGGDSYVSLYVGGSERKRGMTLTDAKSLEVFGIFVTQGLPVTVDFRITSATGGTVQGGQARSYFSIVRMEEP